MIFALLFLLSLVIGAIIYFINRKFKFFDSFGKFILGIVLAIALVIVFFTIMFIIGGLIGRHAGDILAYILLYIGISQFVYIIPAILLLIKNKQYDIMKGVITGAILIALLNGGCFMLFANVRIGG